MVIKAFKDIILLQERRDVLRVHLYAKLIQNGIQPFENDISTLVELYIFGGYNNADQQITFINNCIEKGYKKSEQSVRNTLSKYTSLGVLTKPRNTVIALSKEFLPQAECDRLVLEHKVSHAK